MDSAALFSQNTVSHLDCPDQPILFESGYDEFSLVPHFGGLPDSVLGDKTFKTVNRMSLQSLGSKKALGR
jgi:hypothetical protein